MSRGYEGKMIFNEACDKEYLLKRVLICSYRNHITIYGWCIMDNHYHFVIKNEGNHLSKFMKELNSSYGNLIFRELNEHGHTQYNWVIKSLLKDKDSRQAFMHFNKPRHQFQENKDQVCTLNAIFHIRDNKLNMTLTMRSNDVILGFMTDFTFFSILHQQVYLLVLVHQKVRLLL
jgi:thymidylate synthase